jgi:hypothetical protein
VTAASLTQKPTDASSQWSHRLHTPTHSPGERQRRGSRPLCVRRPCPADGGSDTMTLRPHDCRHRRFLVRFQDHAADLVTSSSSTLFNMATANGADFSTQCYRHGVLIGQAGERPPTPQQCAKLRWKLRGHVTCDGNDARCSSPADHRVSVAIGMKVIGMKISTGATSWV